MKEMNSNNHRLFCIILQWKHMKHTGHDPMTSAHKKCLLEAGGSLDGARTEPLQERLDSSLCKLKSPKMFNFEFTFYFKSINFS